MINFNKIYNISSTDNVFIDTNILIFLFSPSGIIKSKKFKNEKYSSILNELIKHECNIYINSHVVSEFINRCLRDDFNTNFNNLGNKKYKQDYRSSSDYQKTLKIVLKQLNKFLKISKHINDDFESFDISKAYQAREENDFNDLIIADTITKNKLKLLTDDLDFQNSLGIDTQWYLK